MVVSAIGFVLHNLPAVLLVIAIVIRRRGVAITGPARNGSFMDPVASHRIHARLLQLTLSCSPAASKQRDGQKSRWTTATTEHAGHQQSHPRSLPMPCTQGSVLANRPAPRRYPH